MIQQFHFWVYTPPKFHAESCRNICILEFIAVLFIIAKIKEPKHPFAHEWIS